MECTIRSLGDMRANGEGALVSRSTAFELGVEDGEYVSLASKDADKDADDVLARVRTRSGDSDDRVIYVGDELRARLGVDTGARVTVRPAAVEEAQTITIAVPDAAPFEEDGMEADELSLTGRIVTTEDPIEIDACGGSDGARAVLVQATAVEPSEPAVITQETTVEVVHDGDYSSRRDTESAGEGTDEDDVEQRLDDALETVAHGATVSIPSILFQNVVAVAFTAILTNGFAVGAYGLFALAYRIEQFLSSLTSGFMSGLPRYVPTAETRAERDLTITFASILLVLISSVFGGILYITAPTISELSGEGAQFTLFLRIFAVGLPALVWFSSMGSMFRAFEEVLAMNLTTRIAFPVVQLLVGLAGVLVFDSLVAVAVGLVAAHLVLGIVAVVWLAAKEGITPQLRGPDALALHRRYLDYTIPLFFTGLAYTIQQLGFYPLIAWLLSGTEAAVFVVGVTVAGLIRLPLTGINQFISPVFASLHGDGEKDVIERLNHITSRLVLFGATALTVPAVLYREEIMLIFGPEYVAFAWALPIFVLAQYAASAAGAVGLLLAMTDHQKAVFVINAAATGVLMVLAIPLTMYYGLAGIVVSYLLMNVINNALELIGLYYLEGIQPFTRRHLIALLAAVPFAGVIVLAQEVAAGAPALIAGLVLGLFAYGLTLRVIGFTNTERRLGATLIERYRPGLRG